MTQKMSLATVLATVIALFACPCLAQKIDKPDMLETTRKTCPSTFLRHKQFIHQLLIGGGNLPDFCECMAVRFASQLDEADHGNKEIVLAKWAESQKFCLAASLKK